MKLHEYNQRYETIISGDFSDEDKAKMLASLMTDLEREFNISMIRNEAWEEENKAVIALYRKISMSRDL